MIGGQPIASAPIASLGQLPAPDDTFIELLTSPNAATRYIVEIIGAPLNAVSPTPQPMPIAWGPIAALAGINPSNTQFTTLTLSDGYYTTKPTDSIKPNLSAKDRLANRITIERSVPLNPLSSRRSQTQFGEIPIINTDGFIDQFLEQYTTDGRLVRILFGPARGDYENFRVVAEVYGDGWDNTRQLARQSVQDIAFQLDVDFANKVYGGSGLADGDSTLEGVPKPRCVGHVFNISPTLESAVNRIYAINADRPMLAIDEIRDQGVPLTYSGQSVSTYAELVGLTVPAGQYAVALGIGRFKLGATPAGGITVDCKGEIINGSYENSTAGILIGLARYTAGIENSYINRQSFTGLPTGEVGYFFNGTVSPSVADLFDLFLAPLNAVWGSLTNKELSVFQLKGPESLPDGVVVKDHQILDIEEIKLRIKPASYGSMNWRPNWTKQEDGELAGSLSAAEKLAFTSSFNQGGDPSEFFSSGVINIFGVTQKLSNIQSFFWNESDAETSLSIFQALWSRRRRLFRVTMSRRGLLYNLGQSLKIFYPRFGFDNGKNTIIVNKVEKYDENKVEFLVLR